MLIKNDIINNLQIVIDDLKVDEKSSNLSKFSYKDYIYVKQALEYLKKPQHFATLTAKADFRAIRSEIEILLDHSVEDDIEKKELIARIVILCLDYETTHLGGGQ